MRGALRSRFALAAAALCASMLALGDEAVLNETAAVPEGAAAEAEIIAMVE